MRKVFFDLETGGFDPAKHPIIQIAAIAVDADLKELASFECKVDFDLDEADKEALLNNSYDREVWERDSITPNHACNELSKFLKQFADVQMISKAGRPYNVAQLIGHNADSFDGPFLQAWYRRLNQFMPAAFRTLCTYQRALHHFHENPDIGKPESYKLGDLCKWFGLPLENAHDAMGDCRATLAVYKAVLRDSFVLSRR